MFLASERRLLGPAEVLPAWVLPRSAEVLPAWVLPASERKFLGSAEVLPAWVLPTWVFSRSDGGGGHGGVLQLTPA